MSFSMFFTACVFFTSSLIASSSSALKEAELFCNYEGKSKVLRE